MIVVGVMFSGLDVEKSVGDFEYLGDRVDLFNFLYMFHIPSSRDQIELNEEFVNHLH